MEPTAATNALTALSALPTAAWEARALRFMLEDGLLYIPGWTRIEMGPDTWIEVAQDYVAVGDAGARVRCPLSAVSAQKLCDSIGCILPTVAVVQATWRLADVHLPAKTMDPSLRWEDVRKHSLWSDVAAGARQGLLAGHKKDVVVAPNVAPGRVAIYGWQGLSGVPIQGLNTTDHDDRYYDYSHGIRPVKRAAIVRGQPMDLADALAHPEYSRAFSPVPIARARYGAVQAPPGALVLKVGTYGPVVAEWQRTLNTLGARDDVGRLLVVDGVFGQRTASATKLIQRRLQLPETGLVDEALRLRLGASEAPTQKEFATMQGNRIEYDPEAVKFVQAKGYTKVDITKPRPIDLIVIHTMEAPVTLKTAENVASWFGGPQHPAASAHFCVDPDSIVACVHVEDVAWQAPGANNNGIGIEIAGYAKWTRDEWLSDKNSEMLRRVAGLVRWLADHHAVPLVFVDAEGLKRKERGLTTHAAVSKAFGKSDHWDPGQGFPLDVVLDLASA